MTFVAFARVIRGKLKEQRLSKYCQVCGTCMQLNAAFCPQCGVSSARPTPLDHQPHKARVPLPLAVWLVAIPLLTAAVYIGWPYFSKTEIFASNTLHDVELLASDRRSRIFAANFNGGATPEAMLAAARMHCRPLTEPPENLETCAIIMAQDADEITRLNNSGAGIGELWNKVIDKWDEGKIPAIYMGDPDDDSTRDRPDDNFVVDCRVYTDVVRSDVVSCMDRSRSRRMRGWFGKREDAPVEDAAIDARADAMAAARAAEEAATGYVEMPAEEAMPSDAAAAATDADAAVADAMGGFYVVADANRRNRPTAKSSNLGQVSRGTQLGGRWVTGEDGNSRWFRLADGSGYVSEVNVSTTRPPRLVTNLGEYQFRPSQHLQLQARPSDQSPVNDTVPPGTLLVITGITANGFAEAKGRRGGVGYFPAAGYDFNR